MNKVNKFSKFRKYPQNNEQRGGIIVETVIVLAALLICVAVATEMYFYSLTYYALSSIARESVLAGASAAHSDTLPSQTGLVPTEADAAACILPTGSQVTAQSLTFRQTCAHIIATWRAQKLIQSFSQHLILPATIITKFDGGSGKLFSLQLSCDYKPVFGSFVIHPSISVTGRAYALGQ